MSIERQTLWRETFLRVLDHELQMIRENRYPMETNSGMGHSAVGIAMQAADDAVERMPEDPLVKIGP